MKLLLLQFLDLVVIMKHKLDAHLPWHKYLVKQLVLFSYRLHSTDGVMPHVFHVTPTRAALHVTRATENTHTNDKRERHNCERDITIIAERIFSTPSQQQPPKWVASGLR